MARILVAEDQNDLREMISFTLRLAGHQVVATTNGAEALQQAQDTQPEFIILDFHMPRLTGFEVCRQLKELEDFKDTPVIIISAMGSAEEIQAGMEAGASEYIRKPFPIENLTSRVKALLGGD